MMGPKNRKLILEDGSQYEGWGFGSEADSVFELVFNTSMAGYQEILTDPSYTDQGVVMTYPLIGNYGMSPEDDETERPTIAAMILREYNDAPSYFRSRQTLGEVMENFGIPGIYGVDTRKLTRSIRDDGSRRALLTDLARPLEEGLAILRETPVPKDAVARVSCKSLWRFPAKQPAFHIVAVDCGIKANILRQWHKRNCDVTVVPWNTTAAEIAALQPDGVFFSNGPGDPEDVPEVMETARSLRGKYPVFGICLGHQILALSYGAKTYKMKFGHHGGNHPVKDLMTGRVAITAQNHSYAVEEDSLRHTPLRLTHKNLLDGTVEGMICERDRVMSVQFHPESAPGPQDSVHLFDRFLDWLKEDTVYGKTK